MWKIEIGSSKWIRGKIEGSLKEAPWSEILNEFIDSKFAEIVEGSNGAMLIKEFRNIKWTR